MINEQRLWQHIEELAAIGKNADGSITRWPFTQVDKQAEQLLVQWMQTAGLDVQVDYVGNVIGTLHGADASLAPIVCGSHFDSVRCGGKFDGCLGVLAAIEVATCLIEKQVPIKRTLQVIGFRDEEGNRFSCGMVGSKSIAGIFHEQGFASMDEKGITLFDAMSEMGYEPSRYDACKITPYAMYELHIEQAKQLEDKQVPIGIVEGIAGIVRFNVTIFGESGHAGATPMAYRKDPVVAMSEWITQMSAWAYQNTPLVLSVGVIETHPGACNVICEYVRFSVDIRSIHKEQMMEVEVEMQRLQKQLEKTHQVRVEMQKEDYVEPCLCDPKRQQWAQQICEENKIPYIKTMSGAGHDSMNFKDICPVSLLFVRSYQGYSHRKEEFSSKEDCALGCLVLYEMICKEIVF